MNVFKLCSYGVMATELLQSIGSAGDPLVVNLRFSNYIQITPHCPHAAQIIGSKMFSNKEIYSDFLAVRHQLCEVESARKALKVMFNIPQRSVIFIESRFVAKTAAQTHPTEFTRYYRNDTLQAVSCCVALLALRSVVWCGLVSCRVVMLCCVVMLSCLVVVNALKTFAPNSSRHSHNSKLRNIAQKAKSRTQAPIPLTVIHEMVIPVLVVIVLVPVVVIVVMNLVLVLVFVGCVVAVALVVFVAVAFLPLLTVVVVAVAIEGQGCAGPMLPRRT